MIEILRVWFPVLLRRREWLYNASTRTYDEYIQGPSSVKYPHSTLVSTGRQKRWHLWNPSFLRVNK